MISHATFDEKIDLFNCFPRFSMGIGKASSLSTKRLYQCQLESATFFPEYAKESYRSDLRRSLFSRQTRKKWRKVSLVRRETMEVPLEMNALSIAYMNQ